MTFQSYQSRAVFVLQSLQNAFKDAEIVIHRPESHDKTEWIVLSPKHGFGKLAYDHKDLFTNDHQIDKEWTERVFDDIQTFAKEFKRYRVIEMGIA